MTRKQKNLIKILTAVLLLGIIVFVVMSSERMFGENSGATKAPSPTCTSTPTNTPTPVPTSTPTPTVTNTPTPFPTNTPTPTEIIYPFTDVEGIKYMNYAGRMAKLEMADGRLIMGDFGYYTFVDHYGAEHTYRMADYVSIPGEEKLEEGNWFFMGALETPNYVYAQYDYWGNSEYTVFIRVSRTGRNGIMLDYMPYDEMENYRCFTASNEYIFYVDEKDGRYEIIEAGVDGSDARSLVSFEAGMRPTGLWCTETELVFFLNDGKKTSLMAVELRTEKLRTIRASLYASEYLYLSSRFAITGIVNNHLCYVDLANGGEHYLRLVNGNDLYWGEPVCSDTVVYLQFFFWEEENKTQALIIDLNSGSARQTVTFDDELAYLCGCDKDILYAEKDGSYVLYQIENFSP